jgi:predicted transcriptional regulator
MVGRSKEAWYTKGMETSNLQLTAEQRQALLAHPGAAIHIADEETRRVYLLIEQGVFPELEEEYIRARLEEGFAAIERGEEEEWDSESIKAEGRRILQQRRPQQ